MWRAGISRSREITTRASARSGHIRSHSAITCIRNLHVCIIGSGPAGFYTADKLLKSGNTIHHIDVIERLPTPFGLVRSGVAPDHPETKVVMNQFSKIVSSSQCSFFGNVHVGKDVSLADLRELYDVVVLAYGAESDNVLGIPGESLEGVHSAREFVWWYNGHPDCADLPVDLQGSDVAVVLGQGNVAIDISRILLRRVEDLVTTDIADHALAALHKSTIKKVYLVGRRGPAQIACTAKELRELLALRGIQVVVNEADLKLSAADRKELEGSRIHKRVFDLLQKASLSKTSVAEGKQLHFVFYRQPTKFIASEDGQKVAGVQLEKTFLQVDEGRGLQRAFATGIFEDIHTGLVLKSIGYKSLPLEGVPFNHEKGVVLNVHGRVIRDLANTDSTVERGLYVVGWLKRGPTGIIGTNLICAEEVVECILHDLRSGFLQIDSSRTGNTGLKELLYEKGIHYVSVEDWQKIDACEAAKGQDRGKSREKLVSLSEILKVIGLT